MLQKVDFFRLFCDFRDKRCIFNELRGDNLRNIKVIFQISLILLSFT